MQFLSKLWHLIKTAFKYNMIKGAAVIKLIQAVLVLSGHQPWTTDQNASVETLIDFAVAIIVLVGINHAHESVNK